MKYRCFIKCHVVQAGEFFPLSPSPAVQVMLSNGQQPRAEKETLRYSHEPQQAPAFPGFWAQALSWHQPI